MSDTRVGRTLVITGELESAADVVVLGRVDGAVRARGVVEIDRRGRVAGEVRGRAVDVEGEVEGPVTATERVEIGKEGAIVGDIRAPRILIADGARFEGTVHMDRARSSDD